MGNGRKVSVFEGEVYKNTEGTNFVIIEYIKSNKVLVEFQDERKYRKYCAVKEIKSGKVSNPFDKTVLDVGFFGVGPYSGTEVGKNGKKKNSDAYEVWRGILRRCYSLSHQEDKAPSYVGCTVNPIWHCFQNFAYWFYNHEFRESGWHLDKDIIVRDNKEYGPLRCTFVPHDVNVATTNTKAKRGLYPVGVYFKKDVQKFKAQLAKFGSNQKMLIESRDLNECFMAYKKAKEQYMFEIGEMWEGKLDPRVITSLKSWTVRETD